MALSDPTNASHYLMEATRVRATLLQPPNPQSPIAKLQADRAAGLISDQQYEQGVAGITRPLVQFGDKPIGVLAAQKMRDANNKMPDPGMTFEEARQAGFHVRSADQAKGTDAAAQLAPVIASTMRFGFGDDGTSLFPPADKSTMSRLLSAGKAKWQQVTQDPQNPDLLLYNSQKEATLSGLARLTGQVGTLTDRDVDNIRSLWPTPGLTPSPIAQQQFVQIVGLLKAKGLSSDLLGQLGFPEAIVPPDTQRSPGGVHFTVVK